MTWTNVEIAGTVYDLTHLSFKVHCWEIELKNKQKKLVHVDVKYSCHCFTRKPKQDEEFDESWVIMDHTQRRLFDTMRYALSLELPEIIATLPGQKVFQTGHHNLVRVAAVNNAGAASDYFIFFELSRSGKRMKLFVESAYTADLLIDKPKYEKPIRFLVALRNSYEGR